MKRKITRIIFCICAMFIAISVSNAMPGIGTAHAATPVLHFSDLTSGPSTGLGDGIGSGAIVTIWGVNLGSSQGTSTVTVGGVPAAYVYEWQNATQHTGHPADLYTYQKMQVIMFSVPATAPGGATTIKVTVNGVDSNTLPFTVRTGSIYHIKSTGNDSNAGTWASPWLTLNRWAQNSTSPGAGSIVYVSGVNETSRVEFSRTGGSEANPYFLVAYPGQSAGTTNASVSPGYLMGKTAVYGHISKLTLRNASSAYEFIEYGRTIGCAITDATSSPCSLNQSGLIGARGAPAWPGSDGAEGGVNGNIFLGNYVHDYCASMPTSNDAKQQHTMYISNRQARANASGFEIGWNHFNNNGGNSGIRVYDEGSCTNWTTPVNIHNNIVVDQRGAGITIIPVCGSGYGPITTTFNVYDNLVIRGGRGPGYSSNTTSLYGVEFGGNSNNGSGASYTINVYNNTFYGGGECTGTGCRDFSMGNPIIQGNVQFGDSFGAINLKNNIIYDINNYPWMTGSTAATAHSNNLWYSTTGGHAAPPSWDTSPLTSNPLFTSIGTDFTIQSGSPAKDAGTTISFITRDFLGVSRPQGSSYDIGAFEFDAGSSPPSASTHTVTPSAGANGSISPNTAQIVNDGSVVQFTITPNNGYVASITGTCGGSLTGTTYTTSPITTDCSVTVTFFSAPTYTIGGSISNLSGSITLTDANAGSSTVSTTSFVLPNSLVSGSTYNVTISIQPSGRICTVSNGSGTISSSNVTNISVSCANSYTIGGTLSGFSGNGTVTIRNNGGDDLHVASNGIFTFPTEFLTGSSYLVSIASQPTGQTCTVSNGSGTIAGANITGIAISCVNTGSTSKVPTAVTGVSVK
jgi:hypothetical protein